MDTYRETSLAYFAGLFDGEGSVMIQKQDQGKHYQMSIEIDNTFREVLDDIQEFFGVGTVTEKTQQTPSGKPVYRWRVGAEAGYILVKLFPYLRIKKERAELAIMFKSISNERLSRATPIMEDMYEKMKVLNTKGVR